MEKKFNILLVDDESDFIEPIAFWLEAKGYKVRMGLNGQECLDLLDQEEPDIILLDIVLPKMDGWTLLKKIKKDKELKDIPVVIISNLSDEASQSRGIKLGAKDYLAKINYSIEELVDKIKKIA